MKRMTGRLIKKRIYGRLSAKSLRSALKKELLDNFGFENMAIIADLLIDRFLSIIDEFTADKERMQPYQMKVVGVDKNERFGYGKSIEKAKLRTAIVSVITPEEIKELENGAKMQKVRPKIAARILKEAYAQGVVLSLPSLGLILSQSPGWMQKIIERYKKQNPDDFLPHAGTVLDLGRTVSHKEQVVRLYYKGMLTQEIARRIGHHPDRVDRYVNDHLRIVEAYKAGHNVEEISFITKIQSNVVMQHLEIHNKMKKERTENASTSYETMR